MSTVPAIHAQRARTAARCAWAAGAVTCVATAVVAATWTAPGSPSAIGPALRELAFAAPPAAGWVLMAFGVGWPLRRWLGPPSRCGGALQLGLGTALSLALLNAVATLGLLTTPVAWIILGGGALLGVASLLRDRPGVHATGAVAAAAGPAVAILLLAALSPPGWLWSTEFGGYDALSYHLQLPKEWLLDGRLRPADHCVYGFLPGFVESAYLQLMALRGTGAPSALAAATSCQMLHAFVAVAAAWCAGQAAAAWWSMTSRSAEGHEATPSGAVAAGAAAALVLVTPWSVVVGSLAYNEMFVALLLACGLLLLAPDGERRRWAVRAMAVGLLAGAACGAKLTALGFAAIPLGVLLLWSLDPRRWLAASALCIGVASLVLVPWLARNAIATGNPLFPFATSLLGTGHWSAEQAELFAQGHGSELGPWSRVLRLWQQWLVFGLGANPQPGEPWQPQWFVTPWLAAAALIALTIPWPRREDHPQGRARSMAARLGAVLAIQLLMWLVATHLQSRFLVPTVVPAAMAVGLALGRCTRTARAAMPGGHALPRNRVASRPPPTVDRRAALPGWLLGTITLALSLLPAFVLLRERGGAPCEAIGAAAFFAGDGSAQSGDDQSGVDQSGVREMPAHWLNHRLPAGSRVLLVGDARPFWYVGDPVRYAWTTTWDRGAMSAVLAQHPGDVDAQRTALRRRDDGRGFTHLLIDPAMLERWRSSGWADPLLHAESMRPMLDAPNRVLKRFPGGAVLVELGE